jgi:hypothetical protein
MPHGPIRLGVAWTPEDAATVLGDRADPDLLRGLVELLDVPPVEPGRWDAADLAGLHIAVRPWLPARS